MLERFPVPAGPLPPAGNPEFPAVSATASLSARWHEIQALFVPRLPPSCPVKKQMTNDSEGRLLTAHGSDLRRAARSLAERGELPPWCHAS
jgi:hypothetical protein